MRQRRGDGASVGRPHQTRDGWLAVSPYTDGHWRKFFALIGRPELMQDPRYSDVVRRTANIGELYQMLGEALRTNTTRYWVELLAAEEIPVAPVHDMDSLLDDPHLRAVGSFEKLEHPTEGAIVNVRAPVRFSATPSTLRRHAPQLGEHNIELLREAGLSDDEIKALCQARAARHDLTTESK